MPKKSLTITPAPKLAPFKRRHKPTRAELRRFFSMYVEAACDAYRKEERSIEKFSTQDPEWGAKYGNKGINYPAMMMKGIEEISGDGKSELGWCCKECQESLDTGACDCKREDEDDEDDD